MSKQGFAATVRPVTHALEGLRVVDLTSGPTGGIATMVLADFGADVIKVEAPGGDRFRSMPASRMWLRGKRSAVLDLGTAVGQSSLHDLLRTADVLVVVGAPQRAARWGVDAETATTLRPDLVHCSITGWGPLGPLAQVPGYDAAIAARSGRMMAFERQLRRGGPVFAAVPVASHVAAMGAVQGILAALFARARGGGAQRVETSLLQSVLPFDLMELLLVEMMERTGVQGVNVTAAGGDMPTLNYHPVRTADGRWIQCGNLLEHLFMAFLDATGLLDEMLVEERFAVSPGQWDAETVEVVRDMMLTRVLEKTADEWMTIFRENGNVAAEPYLTTAEALHHPDVVGNGDVVTIDDPVVGTVRTLGPFAELSVTPGDGARPAPSIGQHTAEVLAEVSGATVSGATVPGATVPGATVPGGVAGHQGTPSELASASPAPLDGITVVEFATIIAAPLSTSMLTDLGARVIRVEVVDGDPYRHLVPGGGLAVKTTAGKESICLDLKTEDGRAIARQLAVKADVLVHNYRPGVAERLGLGYADLQVANPGLVWVSVAGYGRQSPNANRPATHPCAGAAMGGAGYQASLAVTTDCASLDEVREMSRQLLRANESNPDPNTSVVAAAATLMALVARQRHGLGQAVYVSMLMANGYANADDALSYANKPDRVVPDAELFGLGATYRLYRSADGWVFLAITTDAEWTRFRAAADPRAGADESFATVESRRANDDVLTAYLGALFRQRCADEWESMLTGVRVACVRADASPPGPFFAHHPQMLANDFAPLTQHPRFGLHRRWGSIVTVNGAKPSYAPGVLAGEHTMSVLSELGFDDDQIAALYDHRVVATEAVAHVGT